MGPEITDEKVVERIQTGGENGIECITDSFTPEYVYASTVYVRISVFGIRQVINFRD